MGIPNSEQKLTRWAKAVGLSERGTQQWLGVLIETAGRWKKKIAGMRTKLTRNVRTCSRLNTWAGNSGLASLLLQSKHSESRPNSLRLPETPYLTRNCSPAATGEVARKRNGKKNPSRGPGSSSSHPARVNVRPCLPSRGKLSLSWSLLSVSHRGTAQKMEKEENVQKNQSSVSLTF